MRTRLNVTKAERLHYSYRRLRALSALRNAGIEPPGRLEKTARSSATGRLGYRVVLPDGSDWHCERLVDVEALAAEFARWQHTRRQPRRVSVSLYIRMREGACKSSYPGDWQARISVSPFGVTDLERLPCLLLPSERSMVEPLRQPALVERP